MPLEDLAGFVFVQIELDVVAHAGDQFVARVANLPDVIHFGGLPGATASRTARPSLES